MVIRYLLVIMHFFSKYSVTVRDEIIRTIFIMWPVNFLILAWYKLLFLFLSSNSTLLWIDF
jgi:hypothetical protein